jgi:hypothetical protein
VSSPNLRIKRRLLRGSSGSGLISGWGCEFDDPIELPDGRQLVTLEDAGNHITKLPKAEHWQAAAQALILVATKGGPTMLARVGVMRALNRHVERVFEPSGKKHHWGKRKLKRDEQRPSNGAS